MSAPMSLPQLIAAGDEDAIAGFRDAHIEKVRAYCATVCEPDRVDDACEAAFVDFLGRTLTVTDDERQLDDLLLRATRSAAAPRVRTPEVAPGPRPELCAAVPELLAAKANGELADEHALLTHIKHCDRCQASAVLLGRADVAFRSASGWVEPPAAEPDEETHAPASDRAEQPAPTSVRVRRGGLVGAAKRFGKQLGGR